MTPDEQERALEALGGLALILGVEISATRLTTYLTVLGDLSPTQIEHAVLRLGQTHKFATFPQPAAIREIAEGSDDDKAQANWTRLVRLTERFADYPSLFIQDAAFAEAVLATFGSWRSAAAYLHTTSFEMEASKRNEFFRHYRSSSRQRITEDRRYLPGSHEIESRNNLPFFARRWLDNDYEFFTNEVVIVKLDGTFERRNLPFSLESGNLLPGALEQLRTGQLPESVALVQLQPAPEQKLLMAGTEAEATPEAIQDGLAAFARKGFNSPAPLDEEAWEARKRLLKGQARELIEAEQIKPQSDPDIPFEALEQPSESI